MKYLVIFLLLAGGYWLYTEKLNKPEKAGENLVAQLREGRPVSMQQARTKAGEIVTFLCSQPDLQTETHSSPSECAGRYLERKARCEQEFYPESAPAITTEDALLASLKRYRECAMDE